MNGTKTIRVDAETHRRLKIAAAEAGVTLGKLLEMLVQDRRGDKRE